MLASHGLVQWFLLLCDTDPIKKQVGVPAPLSSNIHMFIHSQKFVHNYKELMNTKSRDHYPFKEVMETWMNLEGASY